VRIAKPLLLVTTPLGVVDGIYECYRLAGGLVVIMLAMVGLMLVALATVVATVRREARAPERMSAVSSDSKEVKCN
jgi:hypothetical protein